MTPACQRTPPSDACLLADGGSPSCGAPAVAEASYQMVAACCCCCCCPQGLTGEVTIATLGGDFPMLAGNVVAIALSALVCIVVSLIKPQNFDWALMKEIPMVEHDEAAYADDGDVSTNECQGVYCCPMCCCLSIKGTWGCAAVVVGLFHSKPL